MSKAIFVTATDTGVGKTTVSAAIASILKENGKSVGYFKPVETGCGEGPNDAKLLSEITGQSLDEVVLYTFEYPVSPYMATKMERRKIDVQRIIDHYRKLREKYEYLIVEGAGGVCVPIKREGKDFYTYIELIRDMDIGSLVVARGGLGTINHTCLTVRALKDRNLNVKGVVMNLFTGSDEDVSEMTNSIVIMEMTGVPVLGKCLLSENPIEECRYSIKDSIERLFS